MVKRLVLISGWFIFTLFFFTFVINTIFERRHSHQVALQAAIADVRAKQEQFGFFTVVPPTAGQLVSSVIIFDNRVSTLEKFFKLYNSPLAGHAKELVAAADLYGLDYRLLPAIAMQESGGARFLPEGTHNAWGYGIYGDQTLGFQNWQAAINRVANGLKKDYIDQGLVTPEQIMTKYTPSSIAKGGTWAKGVRFFMERMD